MTLTKLSLFSGIGGDDIASDAAGIETVCFVERDVNCRKVLSAHWPGVPIIEDVKNVNTNAINATRRIQRTQSEKWSNSQQYHGDGVGNDTRDICDTTGFRIDIISGGFPCQPHSVAGLRKGAADERDLWGEFRRIIGEIKPRWVVAENVPGLLSTDNGKFFRGVLRDLSALGYSVGWCTFGAVDVGAWHRRDRVFIVAYSIDSRNRTPGFNINGIWQEINKGQNEFSHYRSDRYCQDVPDSALWQNYGRERADMANTKTGRQSLNTAVITSSQNDLCDSQSGRQQEQRNTEPEKPSWPSVKCPSGGKSESGVGNLANGFPSWMAEPDGVPRVAKNIKARVAKLKALGNAVVPFQIYQVYKAIAEIAGIR